jgi:hypothetical protein
MGWSGELQIIGGIGSSPPRSLPMPYSSHLLQQDVFVADTQHFETSGSYSPK